MTRLITSQHGGFILAMRLGLCAGVFMALPMELTVAAQEATAPTPEEKWLNIQAQTLAANSVWWRGLRYASTLGTGYRDEASWSHPDNLEPQLLELAVREAERGDSLESVLANLEQRRAILLANYQANQQKICDASTIAVGVVAGTTCMAGTLFSGMAGTLFSGNPLVVSLAGSVASMICGGIAETAVRFTCTEGELQSGIQVRSIPDLLQATREAPTGPDLWVGGGFQESINIRLDDTVDDVLRKHGEIARIFETHELDVKEALDGNFRALQQEMEEKSREILEKMRGEIRTRGVNLPPDVAEAWVQERKRELARQERRRVNTNLRNARVALGGAVALAGLAGEDAQEIGSGFLAMGDAVLGVHGAVEAFNIATEEIGANSTLAGLALSGDLVGIGLNLVGSLLDTGPTPEEVILEEIGKLRQQVAELRKEMHSRFDGVHEHLDQVMERMEHGFASLSEGVAELQGQLRDVQNDLRDLAEETNRLAHSVQYAYHNLSIDHERILYATIVGPTHACTQQQQGDLIEFMRKCKSLFDTRAGLVARRSIEEGTDVDEMLLVDLDQHPDRTTNMSFQQFKQLLVKANLAPAELPRSVVDPWTWLALMAAQDRFLTTYGTIAAATDFPLTGSLFVDTMRGHRSDLRKYIEAVTEELEEFTEGAPRATVFSMLIAEVRRRHEELRELIGSILDAYYADDEVFDGRTRTTDDGTVIPEIRYEGNPYVWDRVTDFYTFEETPEWLHYRSPSECQKDYPTDDWIFPRITPVPIPGARIVPAPRVPLAEWLLEGGVLQFVHEDDLIPARFGLGEIEVCIQARGTRPQMLRTVIRFTPSERTRADAGIAHVDVSREQEVAQRLARIEAYLEELRTGTEVPSTLGPCFDPSTVLLDEEMNRGFLRTFAEKLFEVADRVRQRGPVLLDRAGGTTDCQRVYRNRFEEKQRALSEYVKRRLLDAGEFAAIDRAIQVANAHLRSWLALALDNARWRSDTVGAIVSGDDGFPDLKRLLEDEVGYAWDLASQSLDAVDSLETVLRSAQMRDAVAYGSGHRYLNARFLSLDSSSGEWRGAAR